MTCEVYCARFTYIPHVYYPSLLPVYIVYVQRRYTKYEAIVELE